ncbi:MAG: hypothetical protein AAF502_07760 [Bacteroidota bacterium]
MKKYGLLVLMLSLVLTACRKDINEVVIVDIIPDPEIIEGYEPATRMVNASLMGFVVDETGTPVPNAEVEFDGDLYSTDPFGHFFINDAEMNALGSLVKVRKSGYFDGSRRFFPIEDTRNRIKIELIPKIFDLAFESTAGGTVSLPDGPTIEFSSNTIVAADGSNYTGTVNVAAKWLDPSSSSVYDQMPGGLQGVGFNTNNEEVALATLGMIAVELEGENGEALNLSETGGAILTMPIPQSLLADAPAQIPLWSYNETHGIWVEESVALLQNGAYVGTVSHFSFWNCDIPHPYTDITMTFVDENGIPLVNYQVTLTSSNFGIGSGYTNSQGSVFGIIPAGETLDLNLNGLCSVVLYNTTVGPFTSSADLGVITVTTVNNLSTNVTGSLECNGVPVNDGLLIATYGNVTEYHYLDQNTFDIFFFPTCPAISTVSITGVNLDDLSQSEVQTVTSGITTNIGALNVCQNPLEQYFRITVDGVTKTYVEPGLYAFAVDSIGAAQTMVSVWGSTGDDNYNYYFSFEGATTGDYSNDHFVEILADGAENWFLSGNGVDDFDNLFITQHGDVGDPLTGNFNGIFSNQGTPVNVSGEFRILLE